MNWATEKIVAIEDESAFLANLAHQNKMMRKFLTGKFQDVQIKTPQDDSQYLIATEYNYEIKVMLWNDFRPGKSFRLVLCLEWLMNVDYFWILKSKSNLFL